MSTKLALEQAEAEKRRRVNEKIEKGEAVRMPPVVVGHPCRAAAEKARKIAALRSAGEKREIIFAEQPTEDGPPPISVIATGVPRPDRDGDRCENCTCKSGTPITYLPGARASQEPTPLPMRKPPAPELMPPTEWRPVWAQVRGGNGDTDPGMIVEAKYGIGGDGCLYLESLENKPITMRRLNPGEDPKDVARKLLLDHWRSRNASAPAGFYDGPINRPIKTYH